MPLRHVIRSLDWLAAGATLLLLLISLAMLFSSSFGSPGLTGRFYRQLIAAGIGLVGYLLMARLPYHQLQRYSWLVYGASLAGLIVVAFSAQIIRGTASRLAIMGVQLQPSEFTKVALVVALAAFFARRTRLSIWSIIISGLIVAVPVILISLEPDIGVAGLLVIFWLVLLVFMGLSWPVLGVVGLTGLAGAAATWRWLLLPYQKARLLVFLDPTRDPLGDGYNVVQSIVALGSGRFLGRGLGHGPQSQLNFLPEQHTDFILASIGEELGFIGVVVVMILYGLLLWRLLRIARTTRDPFGQLLAVSTFILLLISFVVSAGMNMGLLPVTGIPLPLISYGGSHLIATLLLLGLVQSVRVHGWWLKPKPLELTYIT